MHSKIDAYIWRLLCQRSIDFYLFTCRLLTVTCSNCFTALFEATSIIEWLFVCHIDLYVFCSKCVFLLISSLHFFYLSFSPCPFSSIFLRFHSSYTVLRAITTLFHFSTHFSLPTPLVPHLALPLLLFTLCCHLLRRIRLSIRK